MGAEDVEVAGRFLAALEAAAESGDREAVYPLLAPDVHQVYRWKETGEVSYERERRIELTIRDGKIGRYEMRIVG